MKQTHYSKKSCYNLKQKILILYSTSLKLEVITCYVVISLTCVGFNPSQIDCNSSLNTLYLWAIFVIRLGLRVQSSAAEDSYLQEGFWHS